MQPVAISAGVSGGHGLPQSQRAAYQHLFAEASVCFLEFPKKPSPAAALAAQRVRAGGGTMPLASQVPKGHKGLFVGQIPIGIAAENLAFAVNTAVGREVVTLSFVAQHRTCGWVAVLEEDETAVYAASEQVLVEAEGVWVPIAPEGSAVLHEFCRRLKARAYGDQLLKMQLPKATMTLKPTTATSGGGGASASHAGSGKQPALPPPPPGSQKQLTGVHLPHVSVAAPPPATRTPEPRASTATPPVRLSPQHQPTPAPPAFAPAGYAAYGGYVQHQQPAAPAGTVPGTYFVPSTGATFQHHNFHGAVPQPMAMSTPAASTVQIPPFHQQHPQQQQQPLMVVMGPNGELQLVQAVASTPPPPPAYAQAVHSQQPTSGGWPPSPPRSS